MGACFGSFEKPRGKILCNHSISLRDRSDSEMKGKPPSTYAPLSTTSMSSCREWTPSFAYTCETCVFPFDNGAPTNMTLEATKGINEGLIQNGYIVVADTIEELAEGLGLPAETLKKTVERQDENYDTSVDSGSYYAHTYPNMSTGNCCGRSVTFGRMIGKALAAK